MVGRMFRSFGLVTKSQMVNADHLIGIGYRRKRGGEDLFFDRCELDRSD